jgi:hypothetical protein
MRESDKPKINEIPVDATTLMVIVVAVLLIPLLLAGFWR